MQKRILPALALSLALLSGCADATAAARAAMSPVGGSTGALGAANVVASAAEELDFVLKSEEKSDQYTTDDGIALAAYQYTIPVLRVETQDGQILKTAATAAQKQALDVATAFNENFTNWVESTDFSGFFNWAQEDYALRKEEGQSWETPYDEEFTYTFWRSDRLISVAGEYYSYTGGVHPNTVLLGWNFDLQTGRFIHPAMLGADSEEFQTAVTAEIIRQADQRAIEGGYAPTEMYWEDYQDIAARWPDYAVAFSDGGMTVTFSAYEMASYAAGPQTFEIDLDFLKPYLSEDGRALLGIPEE
ncbi:DUF3298 and DUF4163 domain-containing protein [Oscillibacter ruminantium]|uniref:DUF3298 and DUF4163 domain-containing protein n=1 Tax=Oscillibacter ruminantium TaxID=1263547 RepID=UPI0033263D3E